MKSDRNIPLINDCVIGVRCKSTTLATLLKYNIQEGTALHLTQGTLAREALETIEAQIVRKYPELKFDSTTLAREYLEMKGLIKLNTGGKGEYTAFRKMRDEANIGKDTHLGPGDLSQEEMLSIAQEDPEIQALMKKFGKNNSETS